MNSFFYYSYHRTRVRLKGTSKHSSTLPPTMDRVATHWIRLPGAPSNPVFKPTFFMLACALLPSSTTLLAASSTSSPISFSLLILYPLLTLGTQLLQDKQTTGSSWPDANLLFVSGGANDMGEHETQVGLCPIRAGTHPQPCTMRCLRGKPRREFGVLGKTGNRKPFVSSLW